MKMLRTVHFSNPHPLHMHSKLFWALLAIILATVILLFPARAFGSEQVIYQLTGGNDGSGPTGLIQDRAGNLYGTAFSGGPEGAGTVFELSPPEKQGGAWTETTLYTFLYSQAQNGVGPSGGVVADAAGNLYGTTWLGGTGGCTLGCGVVFMLAPPTQPGSAWTFTLLYNFGAQPDGSSPEAPLVLDAVGNLFGTTVSGGTGGCEGGCGTVFQLAPPQPGGTWTETTLYNFPGAFPYTGGTLGGVTLDAKGALYGITTAYGGGPAGTVFRLAPPKNKQGHYWKHALLYAFKGGTDGAIPTGNVALDKNGILYGVTNTGGTGDCLAVTCGTVYQLRPTQKGPWTHKIVHTFAGGNDGGGPQAGVILDAAGNLDGTTLFGGGTSCYNDLGCGTLYRLSPTGKTWSEAILHSFSGGSDGAGPGLLLLGAGNTVYGLAGAGADSGGLVFEVTP